MKKEIIEVPFGIKYISEWKDYQLPLGHVIVDKGVTGCGYTEYCLTNDKNIILCSPRKLLLENKRDQHVNDLNILYLENNISEFKDIQVLENKVRDHILNCQGPFGGKPVKFMITYDSTHYLIDILKNLGLLNEFYIIVDEMQSIFLDSYYKSEVEFDFVFTLQSCPNVLYLSATPMLDKYLKKIDEFKDLPFFEIDWSKTGVVESIVIQRKFAKSLSGECIEIINNYKTGQYPYTINKNNIIQSTEAVFYFNSISDIIRVIKKCELTPDQVNIICADTPENLKKLQKIGHDIGRIPLKGESNKMFTFCTKTAYIGSDFYSPCASSYVFANPNISSLALDISLDLPQIVGRQRDRDNPFKNNIVIFYKTLRKLEIEDRDKFDTVQNQRKKSTQNLLDGFRNMTSEQQQDYLGKLKADIQVSQYSKDFISISKKTGLPVYNSFIELANERAWEVAQRDYQDKISVTKALEEISETQLEYKTEIEHEISDFLDNHFYATGIFEEKMKMYCEFMDKHQGNQEVSDAIYFKIKDDRFRKFYNYYGTKGCSSFSYKEKRLNEGIYDNSKESILMAAIMKRFVLEQKYTKKEIKLALGNIYRDLEITTKTPKATDLEKYFKLERSVITDPQTKKKQEGFKIHSLI